MICFKVLITALLVVSLCDARPSRRAHNRLNRVHDDSHLRNYNEGPTLVREHREQHTPIGHVEYARRPAHEDNYEEVQYQPDALHRGPVYQSEPNYRVEPNYREEPLPYRVEPQAYHVNRRHIRPAYANQDPIYTAAQDPYVGVAQVENQQPAVANDYPEEDYSPKPYDFGYDSTDEYGNNLFRKENGDSNGVVTGTYGYRDALGIYRTVEYTADDYGFRARIKSNEPGLGNQAPADTEVFVEPPPATVQEKASARHAEYIPVDGFPPHGQDFHEGFDHQQNHEFIPYEARQF